MSKSPSAFRTISEVAEELDVPAHVLRFWESKFAQVKPMKRGGGRRYYRPADVDLLRGIRELLYTDGLTIKGVQKVLREQGVKSVLARGGNAAEVVVEERAVAGGGGATVVSSGGSGPSLSVAASSDDDEPEVDEDSARRARIEATIRRLTSLRDRLRASA